MENFTVLKIQGENNNSSNKNKKPLSFRKIFLLVNIFLLFLLLISAIFIYSKKLISTKKKAAVRYAFGCINKGVNVNDYLIRDGDCAYVKSSKKSSFKYGQYFFCKNISNPGAGCPNYSYPADEQYVFRPPIYGECFKRNCGTEQIDFSFNNNINCFFSRVDEPCISTEPPPPTPTNTPTPQPATPTLTPTLTLTPTGTLPPTPTNIPTLTITTNSQPTLSPTATPTETILAKTTSTSTPAPPVAGEIKKPLLLIGIPLIVIIVALLF